MERKPGDEEIYCLQPLVVKKKDDDTFKRIKEEATNLIEVESLLKGSWDVIDGQQRLTTIKILLACLKEQGCYNIEYETREGSKDFLSKISNTSVKNEDNIVPLAAAMELLHMASLIHDDVVDEADNESHGTEELYFNEDLDSISQFETVKTLSIIL